jgi:regulator of sigma E protease
MFYAVEALRGKPVGETAQGIAFRVGMFLVLSLMVFVTWNDITVRVFGWFS